MNSMYMLALMSLALVAGAVAELQHDDVAQLCRLSRKAPEITKISEVKSIVNMMDNQAGGAFRFDDCPAKVAIHSLERVVSQEDVCSQKAIDQIVDFWAKYVDKKGEHKSELPKQLKRFFIGYGLQVSKVCKTTMINELENAAKEKEVSEQDVHVVTRAMRASKEVETLLGKKPALENLSIFVQAGTEDKERRKMNLPPKHKKYFELMQERCVNKFKPIYDTLVSPAVRLAAIGLDYKDAALDSSLNAFRETQTYRDWFDVVVACEPIIKVDAVLIPARVLTEDNNVQSVYILEKEDIDELKEKTGLTLEEPVIVEPVDYKVHTSVGDLVVDSENLEKQIKSYKKGFKELMKLRMKLLAKLVHLVRPMMKDGSIKYGLKPVDTDEAGKLVKFGAVHRGNKRLLIGGLIFWGVLIGCPILGLIFVTPLWFIWLPFLLAFTYMALNFFGHVLTDK